MNVGDKLYCYNRYNKNFEKYKIYTIVAKEDDIILISNNERGDIFTIDPKKASKIASYFGNYFYSIKELRKKKLNKLENEM